PVSLLEINIRCGLPRSVKNGLWQAGVQLLPALKEVREEMPFEAFVLRGELRVHGQRRLPFLVRGDRHVLDERRQLDSIFARQLVDSLSNHLEAASSSSAALKDTDRGVELTVLDILTRRRASERHVPLP